MICPVSLALGDTAKQAATVPAQQVFRIEPYRIPYSNLPQISGAANTGNNTVLSRHQQMALLDLKAVLAAESEVELDLTELAKTGRGGFFSSIAGMFAEDVLGIKGGKAIASAVGNAFNI